jgi:hypothetical protein
MAELRLTLLAVALMACSAPLGGTQPTPSPTAATTASLSFSGSLTGQFVPLKTDLCAVSKEAGFQVRIPGRIAGKPWTFTLTIPAGVYRGAASYFNGEAKVGVSDGSSTAYTSGPDASAVVFGDQRSGGVDAQLIWNRDSMTGAPSAATQVAGDFKCGGPA